MGNRQSSTTTATTRVQVSITGFGDRSTITVYSVSNRPFRTMFASVASITGLPLGSFWLTSEDGLTVYRDEQLLGDCPMEAMRNGGDTMLIRLRLIPL